MGRFAIAMIGVLVLVGCFMFLLFGLVSWWGGEAITVAKEEFGPREMLRKYEWFKDAAAQLDKKRADISVYASRVSSMESDYEDTSRKDWDRTDKEQTSLWRNEVAGVTASYNGLAAEYNAQMAKFNWAFCEAGTLLKGASVPLPRAFKPYIDGSE